MDMKGETWTRLTLVEETLKWGLLTSILIGFPLT